MVQPMITVRDVFYFIRGLYRICKRNILLFLNTNFRAFVLMLALIAFWRPVQAMTIFILLFLVTLSGAPVVIRPFTFTNVLIGCWRWLQFLMSPLSVE